MLSTPGGPRCDPVLVKRIVEKIMPKDDVHGLGHVKRVLGYARLIAEREGLMNDVDWKVVELCILLHDVGRFLPGEGHHAAKSAVFARELLSGIGCNAAIIEKVVECILAHSYSMGVKPSSVESRLVSDADKLDALGAIGVFRVIWESGNKGRDIGETVAHYKSKLSRLRDMLYFRASKEIAEELSKRIATYFAWLGEELETLKRYLR